MAGATSSREGFSTASSAAIWPLSRESIFFSTGTPAGSAAMTCAIAARAAPASPSRERVLTAMTCAPDAATLAVAFGDRATWTLSPRPAKGAALSNAPVRSSAMMHSLIAAA